ncbi:kinase-like protein [Macroventuria anomochaeta]|uniref:Kinase-like protein n=1 Tax=Macroventuria anomochaeta TaxID=301207 RepID=A0ACB6S1C8_9PLEO|nr:kinase-like protein [Macroventuria anomochaeta]KAF2627946.1 kinase-like protein [Macroventuria anomochaeta]
MGAYNHAIEHQLGPPHDRNTGPSDRPCGSTFQPPEGRFDTYTASVPNITAFDPSDNQGNVSSCVSNVKNNIAFSMPQASVAAKSSLANCAASPHLAPARSLTASPSRGDAVRAREKDATDQSIMAEPSPGSFEWMVQAVIQCVADSVPSHHMRFRCETWGTRAAVRLRLLPLGNPLPSDRSQVVGSLETVVDDVLDELETRLYDCRDDETELVWPASPREDILLAVRIFASGRPWLRHMVPEGLSLDWSRTVASNYEKMSNQTSISEWVSYSNPHRIPANAPQVSGNNGENLGTEQDNIDASEPFVGIEDWHPDTVAISNQAPQTPRNGQERWPSNVVPSEVDLAVTSTRNSLAGAQTFRTAHSSVASYATAPSGPRITPRFRTRIFNGTRSIAGHASADPLSGFSSLITSVVREVAVCSSLSTDVSAESFRATIYSCLYPLSTRNATVSFETLLDETMIEVQRMVIFPHSDGDIAQLRSRLSEQIYLYAIEQPHLQDLIAQFPLNMHEIFSSQWLAYLKARGIILSPAEELDWSGRGQHVEYQPGEEPMIPLQAHGNLGHGASGVVDKVRCRRIDLARKTIRCNRRLTKEEAVTEVEHLQRLQHRHIVRLVGTYTLKKDLTILLYPAAKWNLEEYMDELLDNKSQISENAVNTLCTFVACLSSAIRYMHGNNVKHMDIKPKNLLVRDVGFRPDIYVADFGIARAYKCAKDSYTGSPTPFTRLYAAPEVVVQEPRGFPADIFSLGCVFMEIFATIMTTSVRDEREELRKACNQTADSTYHANVEAVIQWHNRASDPKKLRVRGGPGVYEAQKVIIWDRSRCSSIVPSAMLHEIPGKRPTAETLRSSTVKWSCGKCGTGPQPFEAA